MKILLIGVIAFVGWSALSTYLYVCKIKGLCNEPIASMQMVNVVDKDSIAADSITIPVVEKRAVVPDTLIIYFAFDESVFNTDAVTEKFIVETGTYLNQNSQARISVTGHTDATGTDQYNQALGYRRAQSVQRHFESKGMSANKIILHSMGEKEPADDNTTRSGRANNRRSVIIIK